MAISRSFVGYKSNFGVLLKVAIVSLVNHAFYVLLGNFDLLSLNLEVFLLESCVIGPLGAFIATLPLSVTWIGVREGAGVYFSSKMELSVRQPFSTALPDRKFATVGCLPGAFLYLVGGARANEAVVVRS